MIRYKLLRSSVWITPFITVIYLPVSVQVAAERTSGNLSGTVLDPFGAVVQNATVHVSGDGVRRTVRSDDEGRYSLVLLEGVYRITASHHGFKLYRRSPVAISANKSRIVNIRLSPADTDERREYRRLFYETIALNDTVFGGLDMVIQFRSRRHDQRLIEYGYAALTYDDLTLNADRIRVDLLAETIVAEGNVMLDEGGRCTAPERVEGKFNTGSFRIESIVNAGAPGL